MALDQKFFKKSTTAATGLADQEQGLTVHIDANDVDSYDGMDLFGMILQAMR